MNRIVQYYYLQQFNLLILCSKSEKKLLGWGVPKDPPSAVLPAFLLLLLSDSHFLFGFFDDCTFQFIIGHGAISKSPLQRWILVDLTSFPIGSGTDVNLITFQLFFTLVNDWFDILFHFINQFVRISSQYHFKSFPITMRFQ